MHYHQCRYNFAARLRGNNSSCIARLRQIVSLQRQVKVVLFLNFYSIFYVTYLPWSMPKWCWVRSSGEPNPINNVTNKERACSIVAIKRILMLIVGHYTTMNSNLCIAFLKRPFRGCCLYIMGYFKERCIITGRLNCAFSIPLIFHGMS